jgi:two-component system OmpR family sensor kinase
MVPMPDPARLEFTRLCEGIGRTQRLVEQLLALARTQDGPIEGPSVALEEVIRATVEELLPLSLEKGIDLGIAERRGTGPSGPESHLRAVVRNLVENALRYAPQGGRVDISLVDVPGGALLSVEDDGPGIPPQERESVFDPFHRGAANEDAGSGLGLSIVRSVCERLGASITLGEASQGGLRADVFFPGKRA